jgi:RNA methyltransferase, TrmH family
VSVLRSRENPRVKRWAKLARDARLRKKERRALIEGPHLVAACLEHGLAPAAILVSEKAEMGALLVQAQMKPVVLSESVFRSIVEAETPQGIAAEIEIPQGTDKAQGSCVFLEGIQDPGNVGAIIRSAAAFGTGEVVVDRACADPWSPKVLRAGMGGHFALAIREVALLDDEVDRFNGRLVCTVPKGGIGLKEADLSGRLGWVFGAEGRGVSEALKRKAALLVTIPMAAAAESLNVAAAAAICLYEAVNRLGAGS